MLKEVRQMRNKYHAERKVNRCLDSESTRILTRTIIGYVKTEIKKYKSGS